MQSYTGTGTCTRHCIIISSLTSKSTQCNSIANDVTNIKLLTTRDCTGTFSYSGTSTMDLRNKDTSIIRTLFSQLHREVYKTPSK